MENAYGPISHTALGGCHATSPRFAYCYDLYFIASHVSLDELFARSADKYPQSRGFGMRVVTALVDFDVADQQDEPTLLLPVEWDQVKAFFMAEARRLGRQWFGQVEGSAEPG